MHAGNSFVTLTYNDSGPSGKVVELNPADVTKWLKRLRKRLAPLKLRYYLVGEYGDTSFRPHFHVALFGLDPLVGGGYNGRGGIVHETWCHEGCLTRGRYVDPKCVGFTFIGDLSPQSASYICGYVTKKMTKKEDPRLEGKHPEFARMSRKPGLGADAMKVVASGFGDHHLEYMLKNANVPTVLEHGGKSMPLGRYLVSKLREALGYGRDSIEDSQILFWQKMRQMFEDEKYAAKKEKRPIKSVVDLNMQKILTMEKRFKIFEKKGSL